MLFCHSGGAEKGQLGNAATIDSISSEQIVQNPKISPKKEGDERLSVVGWGFFLTKFALFGPVFGGTHPRGAPTWGV